MALSLSLSLSLSVCLCVKLGKMLSMAIQPSLNESLKPLAFPSQNFFLKPSEERASIFARPPHRTCQGMRIFKLSSSTSASAAEAAVAKDTLADDHFPSESPPDKERLGVVVKPMEKPRLVLKFIWMEKYIGRGKMLGKSSRCYLKASHGYLKSRSFFSIRPRTSLICGSGAEAI